MTHTLEQFTELVRIAKLQLSGLRDGAVASLLPGAPRISISVSDLLDEMLNELRGVRAPHEETR